MKVNKLSLKSTDFHIQYVLSPSANKMWKCRSHDGLFTSQINF